MNRKNGYVDMEKYRETSKRQKRRYYGKTAYSANSGAIWTQDEIDMVMKHEHTDHELSVILGRSVNSIQKMRCMTNKNNKL